jgi:hypothetical protein
MPTIQPLGSGHGRRAGLSKRHNGNDSCEDKDREGEHPSSSLKVLALLVRHGAHLSIYVIFIDTIALGGASHLLVAIQKGAASR